MTDEFSSVTPYLHYPDGDAAAEWLCRVFGFGPVRRAAGPDGRWAEGEVAVGPVRIDISGGRAPTDRSALIVGVPDVDKLYERIRAAGVELDPPRDAPYGPRTCQVDDPWGHHWYFWQGDAKY